MTGESPAGIPPGCLYIPGWNESWETHETRKLKRLSWLRITTKQGDAYMDLVEGHENGPAHLGVWVAIVQLAATCKPRGCLVRDCGKPHDAASIARRIRMPQAVVTEALARLSSPDIGWIAGESPGNLPASSRNAPPTGRDGTGEDATKEDLVPTGPCDARASPNGHEAVAAVIAHYRTYHPRSRPGDKERRLISARLKDGWSAEDLCAAIDGNHRDPHCCGENERGKRYHGLKLIMRDSSQVERYIEVPERAPVLGEKTRQNIRAGQNWLDMKEAQDGNHRP